MDDPAEEYEPEDSGQTEMDKGHQQTALDQLPQARDEETAQRGDHITRRSLASHMDKLTNDSFKPTRKIFASQVVYVTNR